MALAQVENVGGGVPPKRSAPPPAAPLLKTVVNTIQLQLPRKGNLLYIPSKLMQELRGS